MRVSDRTKPRAAGRRPTARAAGRWPTVAAALLLAGCSTTIDGTPTAAPGGAGPTGSTPPSSTTPSRPTTPTRQPPPTTPTRPGGAISLPANDNGYVFIETKSGRTRCQINTQSVGCEAQFTNSPMKDGERTNGVSVTAAGKVQWVLGNLGDIPAVTIDYRTYDAQGWTIAAGLDGTTFTNNRTGHGMFVSIDKVTTF